MSRLEKLPNWIANAFGGTFATTANHQQKID